MVRRYFWLASVAGALTASLPTHAADQVGNYATRGAGNASCSEFVDARNERGERYANFGGWIDGFLSAVNFFEEETFDIAPWQSTNLLSLALSRYCTTNPDVEFHVAVSRLVVLLGQQRLRTKSELRLHTAEKGGKKQQIVVYEAVIRRVQVRLKALGLLDTELTEDLTKPVKDALRTFQTRNNLEQTGLPDQPTLLLLLDPGAVTASPQ